MFMSRRSLWACSPINKELKNSSGEGDAGGARRHRRAARGGPFHAHARRVAALGRDRREHLPALRRAFGEGVSLPMRQGNWVAPQTARLR
jgi:hypothetical protein